MTTTAKQATRIAIEHHHDVVATFESYYRDMERDRFSNAFTYGRYKIDMLLDDLLQKFPAASKVLDIGCGTGVYLRRFQRFGLSPTGVEPAQGMYEAAVRDNPGVRIVQASASALPFVDKSFDAVVAIEVLRYLDREARRKALTEMVRVLRPGGLLFVTLVNRFALDGFWLLQRLRQHRKGIAFDRKNPHCEFSSPREASLELEAAGAVRVRTAGRLFAPMRIVYKTNIGLARRIAARIEVLDDWAHENLPFTKPFAGHLVAIGERPG